ncbi:MAG: slipin family protein [Deltaproteobacteria bacterium]|nr:slipin family protein [Deltaproteobacteria bacterium]
MFFSTPIIILILLLFFLISAVKILSEYERGVVFRLGRALERPKGPGVIIIIPMIDRLAKVNLQLMTYDVPSQDIITRDNVTVRVNAVVYFRVVDPWKAIIEVRDYNSATQLLAQTTLRSVCGQSDLDDLLSARDKINAQIADILDKHTDPWGIKVTLVELKAIDLPIEMQRAMAKQAEAERERRAKVINAEGEYQAAAKMTEAAKVLAEEPISLQLRYLQTLREIAAEKNSTTLFPIPIDLVKPFIKIYERLEQEGKV